MSTLDPYRISDQLEETALETIVTRLEARGDNGDFQRMLEDYLDAMGIDSASTVLDVGCGTGVAARAIAKREGFRGRVTGIDLSPHLVAAADRLAREEGLDGRFEFRAGDTHSLEIGDGVFSHVVAHTLVSHVDDPAVVVGELARVVEPGGMVAIFDGDYASVSFSHEDDDMAKEYDEAISAIVTNPRVMRQMPRLLPSAGLELVESRAYILSEIGKADFWLSGLESFRRLVPVAGVKSKEEMDAWADGRRAESEAGIFFASSAYYAYIARRPD
jgi:ubiquinone/menaquinone biosynthesis C-methylase UbiE